MIKVFVGEDFFNSYRTARSEAVSLAEKNKLPLKILDCDEYNQLDEFLNQVESIDMFSEESVIFAKRFFKNKKISQDFKNLCERIKNYNIVFWEDEKPDGRSANIKFLKTEKLIFEYKKPNAREVESWLKNELKKLGIDLQTKDIKYIIEALDSEIGLIANEIPKLKSYCTAKKVTSLDSNDIDKILGFDIKGNIWKFIESFSKRNTKLALTEFEKLTAYEDNTQMLIAMIAREIDILIKVKLFEEQGLDLGLLKLHPFVLQKAKSHSKNFSVEELSMLNEKLLDLDFSIKQGKIDQFVGLTLFLLAIK